MKRLFMLMLVALCVASLLLGCVPGTPEEPTEPTAAPTDPAPTDPAPTDPAPTDPAPTDPAPTDPAPTDPAPTDPAPTDPAPTDPPHTHTAGEDDGDCTTDILCSECGKVAVPGAEAHDFGYNNKTCANCATSNPNYVEPIPELAIPENSVLLTDFTTPVTPHLPPNWGSSEGEFWNNYVNLDGRGGVFAMGATGESFAWFNGFGTTNINLTGMDTITYHIKVEGSVRAVWIWSDECGEVDVTHLIPVRDQWTELTVSLKDIGLTSLEDVNITLRFATWDNGAKEYIWLDQAYATNYPEASVPELEIPEGATMLEDFSEYVVPSYPDPWSTDNEIFAFLPEYENRAGVIALGSSPISGTSCGYYSSIGMNNLNLTELESITFRIKVSSGVTMMWLADEMNSDYLDVNNMLVKDEWFEVTLPMSAVSHWKNKENFTITFQVQVNGGISEDTYYVWIDQIYATPKSEEDIPAVEELPIPEGSILISDYSTPVTPHLPGGWGSDTETFANYTVLDGRAGVFAMGASEGNSFAWFNAIGMNGLDLTNISTVTLRMKMRSGMRAIYIQTGSGWEDITDIGYAMPVADEWTEFTIDIDALALSDADRANWDIMIRFANAVSAPSCDWIWLDQVYATPKV